MHVSQKEHYKRAKIQFGQNQQDRSYKGFPDSDVAVTVLVNHVPSSIGHNRTQPKHSEPCPKRTNRVTVESISYKPISHGVMVTREQVINYQPWEHKARGFGGGKIIG